MTLKELESKVVSLANSPDYHKTYVFMDEAAVDERLNSLYPLIVI